MLSIFASLALLSAASCTPDQSFSNVNDEGGGEFGSIEGRVCDTARQVWLEGAQIYTHLYDSQGALYDTRVTNSDEDGWWKLVDLPGPESYDVYVTAESDVLEVLSVEIGDAEDKVLPEPSCFEDLQLDVAVVTGDYDDFGTILAMAGVQEYTSVNGQTGEELLQFLTDPQSLALYDVIFFSGGHIEEDVFYDTDGSDTAGVVTTVLDTVRTYVERGGAVFTSDWSYDVAEVLYPDAIDFLGDDGIPDDAQQGEVGTVLAQVVDPALAGGIDASEAEVVYDLTVWPVAESAGVGTTVHITGTATYRDGDQTFQLSDSPLLLSREVGQGLLLFSSYRNESNPEGAIFDSLRYMLDRVQE